MKPRDSQKLSAGKHVVTVLFDDGKVDVSITVAEAEKTTGTEAKTGAGSPVTGDVSDPGLWTALMLLGASGIAGIQSKRKKSL